MAKLAIKKVERGMDCPCTHDKTHIIDLLTGRISDKNREMLAVRLDECEVCRELLAELSLSYTLEENKGELVAENHLTLKNEKKNISCQEIEAQWAEIKAQWAEIREQWADIRKARRELEKGRG